MNETNMAAVNSVIKFQEKGEMEGKFLTFVIDNQLFGIPIADVVQIVQIQQITQMPEYPVYAKGIINLRGSMIPVIDVRLRLNKVEMPYDEHTCIIVIMIDDINTGLIVDRVDEVISISAEEISLPPKRSLQDTGSEYLTGIATYSNQVVLLLDSKKIVSDKELSKLQQNL